MVKALQTAARRPTLAYIASWFMACAWILVMPGPGLAQAYPDGKPIKFISGADQVRGLEEGTSTNT
jgi:hypothetical protein